ncbi:unnamed protein product [Rotaria sordida]|uniref:Uncharacterized protein n=1 Tax=Rotaria sordida TaxID=392033 RepID=A0A815F9F4_9BILA|nr:unnamed protein product [Rotaria sordida]CAF1323037.1 unnamed protein product [Rotaria sordida]
MFGIKLTIEFDVKLYFTPNNILLLLGYLNAIDTPKDLILLRLINKKFVIQQITNGHNTFQYHFTDEVSFSKYKVNPLIDRLTNSF